MVELEGHVFDLLDVETQFRAGAVRVTMIEGAYYLVAAPLEGLGEDEHVAAHDRARDVVRYVNLTMSLCSPAFRTVGVAAVRWIACTPPQHRFEFEQTGQGLVRSRDRGRVQRGQARGGPVRGGEAPGGPAQTGSARGGQAPGPPAQRGQAQEADSDSEERSQP